MRRLLPLALVGCATTADLGLLQHAPGDGTGASLNGHWGIGAIEHRIVALELNVRGDLATSGNRVAIGGDLLGGLPLIGASRVLARAGLWHALASSTDERGVVPTFEVAGFIPLTVHPPDPDQPQHGSSTAGLVIGVREDLAAAAYTTVFVGITLFAVPGF